MDHADTILNKLSMTGMHLHVKFCEPKLISVSSYHCNVVFMMKFTKLTSVTWKIGQGDADTTPSRFSMRGTCTPNLVIPAHLLLELSRKRRLYDDL